MRKKTTGKLRFHSNHGSAALTPPPQGYRTVMGVHVSGLQGRDAGWKHLTHTTRTHPWTPAASRWHVAGRLSLRLLPACFTNFYSAHPLCFQPCAEGPAWQSRWSLLHHLLLTPTPLSRLYPYLFYCFREDLCKKAGQLNHCPLLTPALKSPLLECLQNVW